MQIVNQPMQATAKNIQPANPGSDFYHPDSVSSSNNPQSLLSRKNRTTKPSTGLNYKTGMDCLLQRNGYSIHLVNSFKQRIKASTLIKRMYASRGYQTENTSVFSAAPDQYTFEAQQSGWLIGTLTLTIDTGKGLLADTLYQTELDQIRQQGRKLCEVSKLAFNPETSSKEIFASLFHMAYIFAHRIHGADDAFIEINPRHAAFYKRMLGFCQIGELRTCPRVNAPAVLLHLGLGYMEEKIITQTGQLNQKTKSIYPLFLSLDQEKEIICTIQTRQADFTCPSIQKANFKHYPEYHQLT